MGGHARCDSAHPQPPGPCATPCRAGRMRWRMSEARLDRFNAVAAKICSDCLCSDCHSVRPSFVPVTERAASSAADRCRAVAKPPSCASAAIFGRVRTLMNGIPPARAPRSAASRPARAAGSAHSSGPLPVFTSVEPGASAAMALRCGPCGHRRRRPPRAARHRGPQPPACSAGNRRPRNRPARTAATRESQNRARRGAGNSAPADPDDRSRRRAGVTRCRSGAERTRQGRHRR